MARKRHNPTEIQFCQSNEHQSPHNFKPGDIAYLVEKELDGGQKVKIVVCEGCFKGNGFELIEEIEVKDAK